MRRGGDRAGGLIAAVVPALVPMIAALTTMPAAAHFQEIIPSPPLVTADGGRAVDLDLTFTHPMAGGPVMPMGQPRRIGVWHGGIVTDLTAAAAAVERQGAAAYRLHYAVTAPGDHVFFIAPAAYWEPSEGKMIVHYAKVVVNAFGAEDGWDRLLGLPVEIEPLSRPYGLWTGNLFRGVVRKNGTPVPFAEVEVEYRAGGTVAAPADPFVTQVVKADANGTFAYAMPRAGWWGFAALVAADAPMTAPTGASVPVEEGGLIWVNVQDMPDATPAGDAHAPR
jgi:cobalt/nickel transport protein